MKRIIIILVFLAGTGSLGAEKHFESEIARIDSLLAAGDTGNDAGAEVHDILTRYASVNPEETMKLCYRFKERAYEHGAKNILAIVQSSLGTLYLSFGNYEKALEMNLKAEHNFEEIRDFGAQAWQLVNTGNLYFSLNYYEQALKYYKKSVDAFNSMTVEKEMTREEPVDEKLFEMTKMAGLAVSYNNIGLSYREMGDYDKALEYFLIGMDYRIKTKGPLEVGHSLVYIGRAYHLKKDYALALKYFKDALALYDKAIDTSLAKYSREAKIEKCVALNQQSRVYADLGDYEKAYADVDSCVNLAASIEAQSVLCKTYLTSAEIAYQQRAFNKGLKALKKSSKIIEKFDYLNDKISLLQIKARILSKKGDHGAAFETMNAYADLKDSLNNSFRRLALKGVEDNVKLQREVSKLEFFQKDNKIKELKLSQQENLIIFLVIAAALVIIIAGITFYNYIYKQKTNKLLSAKNEQLQNANEKLAESESKLAEKNEQLHDANEVLTKSEVELKELNAMKDKFFSIIAHDLKNPFGTFKNATLLLHEMFDELAEEEKREFISEMNKSADALYQLLENLLTWSRSQRGKIDYMPRNIPLLEIVKDNYYLLQGSAQKKNIELRTNVNDDIRIQADVQMISTVMRNLISNAIKFTPVGGQISALAEQRDGMVEISVADTGVGIGKEDLGKLFRIDVSFSTAGTSNEKGTGLGLILCKEFVERHGGEISVESEVGIGTTFTFTVPIGSGEASENDFI